MTLITGFQAERWTATAEFSQVYLQRVAQIVEKRSCRSDGGNRSQIWPVVTPTLLAAAYNLYAS